MKSHEHHDVWNHWHLNYSLNSFPKLTTKKCTILRLFAWKIHQWTVDSPHKGPVTEKAFPCHDVIMDLIFPIHLWLICSTSYCIIQLSRSHGNLPLRRMLNNLLRTRMNICDSLNSVNIECSYQTWINYIVFRTTLGCYPNFNKFYFLQVQ